MNLGPLQKEWMKELREHPERQHKRELGIIDPETNSFAACCLGMALIVIHGGVKNLPCYESGFCKHISDGSHQSTIAASYEKIGLHSSAGFIMQSHLNSDDLDYVLDNFIDSLIDLNDNHMTWPEIADFIERNPEAIFKESK